MARPLFISVVCLLSLFSCVCAKPIVENQSEWMMVQLFHKMLSLDAFGDNGNGGISCAGCTFALGLIEQLAEVKSQTVDQVLQEICSYLPIELQLECDLLVDTFGPAIVVAFDNNETPDMICLDIGTCKNATCRLFPLPSQTPSKSPSIKEKIYKLGRYRYENLKRPSDLPTFVWPWERVADHLPVFDSDGDYFSTSATLRGYHWRGGDCNDEAADIYPGRKESNYPDLVDHNCNGISGNDGQGNSYENLLCSDTPQFGTILLGDSAGAHFHIPAEWVTASEINETVYQSLISIAEDELDWPMMSSATGYMNISWTGHPVGPVDSGYLRTWQRNHCSFRDYQNIGVNGARSSSMVDTIIKTMARNGTFDFPVSLTYALIGNDVCNGHYGTDHMTTPQEFYQNVIGAMEYLDETLPSGSHVSLVGIADGRILYDAVGERIHPIGALHNNVKYKNFYDFLNCLGISPCFGWMNSNEFWRNATTERAFELNDVYRQLIKNNTFKNFDMHYFDCPLSAVVTEWEQQGGQAWQLIEPVDGFHPNQLSDALTTGVLWDLLDKAGLLPPVNPNNAEIEKLFGDQGGYVPQQKKKN